MAVCGGCTILQAQLAEALAERDKQRTIAETNQRQLDKVDEVLPRWEYTGRGRIETINNLRDDLDAAIERHEQFRWWAAWELHLREEWAKRAEAENERLRKAGQFVLWYVRTYTGHVDPGDAVRPYALAARAALEGK